MDLNSTINLVNSHEGTAIASSSSVISLLISVYVAVSLNNIRKMFKFRARIPKVVEDLNVLASTLSDHLDTYSNLSSDIRKTLTDIDVLLETLYKISDTNLRKSSKEIRTRINRMEKTDFWAFLPFNLAPNATVDYKKALSEIHMALYKLHKQTIEKIEDSKWE
ncbi:MAG: hypothetical protein Q8S36_10700 [Sulfuricurvum sp.]|nr:hypothetical protein [Sulfuricurvum sp.]